MHPGSKLEPYGGVKGDVDRARSVGTPEWNAQYQNKRELDRTCDTIGT